MFKRLDFRPSGTIPLPESIGKVATGESHKLLDKRRTRGRRSGCRRLRRRSGHGRRQLSSFHAEFDAAAPSADSPCGELRAEVLGEAFVLRDRAGGASILEFPLPFPVAGLAFSSDGRHLAALFESGLAWVWSEEPSAVRALWLRSAPAIGIDPVLEPR